MQIIDGRNPHAVPARLSEDQFNALNPTRIATYLDYYTRTSIKIYLISDMYVAATHRDQTLILCGEWKTIRGVSNWIARMFDHVEKIY